MWHSSRRVDLPISAALVLHHPPVLVPPEERVVSRIQLCGAVYMQELGQEEKGPQEGIIILPIGSDPLLLDQVHRPGCPYTSPSRNLVFVLLCLTTAALPDVSSPLDQALRSN